MLYCVNIQQQTNASMHIAQTQQLAIEQSNADNPDSQTF